MKLDNNLLRQMIAEALEEASKEFSSQMSKDAEKDKEEKEEKKKERVNVSGGQEFDPEELQEQEITPEIAAAQKRAAKEETKEADALAADKAEKLASLEADKAKQALGESFQLTKGRLRQIISEELISAKKQGIL